MFDVERFVDDVKQANVQGHGAVADLLARSVSMPAEVLAGLGEPGAAGVHTLHRADNLTILNIIWAPHMVLLPHNHNMWAAIGIYTGREDNILWERQGERVQAVRATSLSEKDMFPLGKDGIHSVVNPAARLTGAIHIYGGDFFDTTRSQWNPETLEEEPSDGARIREMFRRENERLGIDQDS